MNTIDSPSPRILDAYKASVFAKDVDALLALYDQDIHIFDMWGTWSYQGIEAWRAVVANWFETLGSERVVVDFADIQTVEAFDVVVSYAFVTYKALSSEGIELRSMSNRMTAVMRKKNGVWKIIHEHTSAPVNHETLKVILKR